MPGVSADQDQRDLALDPAGSFCVSAPAGSGKTELLIQRFLLLLSRVDQPEQVLAVTFTRKAAAEMRSRVLQALLEAGDQSHSVDEHRARTLGLARAVLERSQREQWDLMRNPARLNIRTIDGLCAYLARQMPVLSGFGANVAAADDGYPAYREATRQLLEVLADSSAESEDLKRLMLAFDGNWQKLEQLLEGMLACREQWLVHMGTGLARQTAEQVLEQSVKLLVEDALSNLSRLTGAYRAAIEESWSYSQQKLGNAEVSWPGSEASALAQWLEIAELLLVRSKPAWKKTVNKNHGFPVDNEEEKQRKAEFLALLEELSGNEELREALAELRLLPRQQPGDRNWQLLLSVSRLLPRLVARLNIVFQRQGQVDHTQVALAALEALGSDEAPTDLALKLDYQLQHILIDEFQDTAVNQFELVRRLTRGWDQDRHTNPENPRTLFIVGDAMQSIYGFRDADVGLFLQAREHGIGGFELMPLRLHSNFRSDPALVRWVNDNMAAALPGPDDVRRGRIGFSPATPERGEVESAEVHLRLFEKEDREEAVWICDRIEEGMGNEAVESIAVLVRSRSHLFALVDELKQREIPWQARDIDPLADSSVVRDLLSLYRALHNFSDRVSWLALLRAPWCALEPADLLRIGQDPRTIWYSLQDPELRASLSEAARPAVEHLVAVLNQSLQWRERLSLRRWLQRTWEGLAGPAAVTELAGLEDARSLLDLLEAYDERAEGVNVAELERDIANLFASSGQDSKLELMTLHKAKGLEFDWVFMPGLARATRSEERELLLWGDYRDTDGQRGGFFFAVNDEAEKDEPTLYRYLHEQKKRKREEESARLMYVGVTRAVNRLFLTAELEPGKEPESRSLLAKIWGSSGEDFEREQTHNTLARDTGSSGTAGGLLRLREVERISQPKPSSINSESAAVQRFSAAPGGLLARSVGTVVHQSLQRLCQQGGPDSYEPGHYLQWWEVRLRSLMHSSDQLAEALERVRHHVEQTLQNPTGQALLADRGEHSGCEVALSSFQPGPGLVQHVIDRTYVEDNVRWLVDYKTSVPDSAENLQQFLERETANYRPQLQRYSELYRQMETRPVRAALYFTGIPHWQEVTLTGE